MKKINFKKALSIILVVLMLFTAVPAGVFAVEGSSSLPVIKSYGSIMAGDLPDHLAYRESIVTATFLDNIDASGATMVWDISAAEDGSVKAWLKNNQENSEMYDLYIGGTGGVQANENSANLFCNFTNLKEIKGLENYETSNVTNFASFFQLCGSIKTIDLSGFDTSSVISFNSFFSDCQQLESVNLSGWDTSNATNMGYMFNNCLQLSVLDLNDFDTKKVTNMFKMFYKCEKLTTIYVGDGWSVDKVSSSNQMFNCCDVLKGKIVWNRFYVDKTYANTEGYLTYKAPVKEYKVTYEFKGEVPTDVSVPEEFKYNAGSDVSVEANPIADGYIFSGWSTEDANVQDGSFIINNDVHFVGTWTKINYYDVTYKFTGDIPAGATVPEKATYEEGKEVTVADTPSADGYIFSGWSTGDADISSGKFNIYNDVEIVGEWTKLYKVTYEYIGTAPTDATALPMPESYKAGDKVDVADLATAYGYTFSGWTTDVSITDGNFTMPARDVVLKGYFKKTVDGVEIKGGDIELKDGEDVTIKVVVTPDNGIGKEVEYKSSDETIVTVDSNGKITALGEGEAFIIVTSKDDSTKSDMIKVTVYKEYDVTYEFKGTTIPENVKVPEKTTHKSGSDVSVEVNPTADGYIFSGWSTENANVQDGSFIINNDVKFVGEWTKLYKVSYAYDSEYAKPVGAPNVPDSATYKAGEKVTVKNALLLPNYDFTGWYSKDTDVDIADGEFIMPERDITLYGRFEKSIVPVDGITVDKNDINLEIGDKEKITVTVTPDDATEKGVTYESSDETVVKVDENGNIEAVGEGEATITATSKADSTKKATVKVKVKKPYISVDDVTADKTEFELEVGEKDTIKVTVTPDDATEKGVIYESSDEEVVTVDENGNIKAVGDGEATITVTSKADDTKKVTIKVKVKKPVVPVEKVEADKTELDLEVGGTDTIKVTVTPDNATEKGVTYESSDESVVTVDENGNIKAVGDGEATITVTTSNGKTDTVKVTVIQPVDSITVDKDTIDLEVGEKDTIKVTVTPDDATEKGVTYESSDEDVVKVDENGNIEAVGDGEATITVTSKSDATKKTIIKVTVKKPAETPDVDEPDIDEPEVNYVMEYPMSVVVKEGETKNLGVKVLPEEGAPAVKYTSSDESIVTVDADGNITGVAEGTATVTAELPGGNIAVITVTVTFKTSHYIVFGKTEKIGWYSVSMDGGENFMVVFGNSNLEVAEGTELIIRANDVLGDPFTFYINGNAATPDENGYVRVVVDGYMLIGALGVPVIAPDTEESLSLIQRLIKSIREFFAKIASWFGF